MNRDTRQPHSLHADGTSLARPGQAEAAAVAQPLGSPLAAATTVAPVRPYRYRSARSRLRLLQWALIAADGAAILNGFFLAHAVRFGTLWMPSGDFTFVAATLILGLTFLQMNRAYSIKTIKDTNRHINALFLGFISTVTAVLVIGFAVGYLGSASRMWFAIATAVAVALILAGRTVAARIIKRVRASGLLRERVALVGATPRAERVLERFRAQAALDYEIVGLFDDRLRRVPAAIGPHSVVGDTDDLMTLLRSEPLDRVIITLPDTAQDRLQTLLGKLRQTPVRLDMAISPMLWEAGTQRLERVAGVPVLTMANYHVEHQMGVVKRAEDIVLASLMLILLAPLMLTTALLIRLGSRGPALYRQPRYGFNNQLFSIFKFRSMYVGDAPDNGSKQAQRDDPRITPIGRFIRRTSIDELPQLFNVLMGDMSVVGPRPHAVPHNELYGKIIDQYFARHNVRPGITGWAQVNGLRGETETDEKMRLRVEHDIAYIEHWSVLFDIKIILLTALRVWGQKTAY